MYKKDSRGFVHKYDYYHDGNIPFTFVSATSGLDGPRVEYLISTLDRSGAGHDELESCWVETDSVPKPDISQLIVLKIAGGKGERVDPGTTMEELHKLECRNDCRGRIWTKIKVCNFWEFQKQVLLLMPVMHQLFSALGEDISAYSFEFADELEVQDHEGYFVAYSDLDKEAPEMPAQDRAYKQRVLDLMRQQHLNPKAKAELGKEAAGSVKYSQVAAANGANSVAQYRAAQTIGDSVVSELLK